jgi:hypothetical protein
MATPIQSMPFLPLDGKSLITYPPSVLVKVILSVDSSRQQFRLQPQPPALTTVRLPVALTIVTAKPLSALITTTAASFDRSCSHSYQLRLQPSYQQIQPNQAININRSHC